MVTDYIRGYVKEECSRSTLTQELYENHILVTASYGARLARLLGADTQVVELASYLHDLSLVHDFEQPYDHRMKGSIPVDELLKQFKFSEETIDQVKEAILLNTKPLSGKKASIEAICLSNADAMSKLAKPFFWLYYGYNHKKRSYKEGIAVYLKWMEDNWKTMIDPAKEMMTENYEFLKYLKKSNPSVLESF